MKRDIEKNPYSPDEQRVVNYILSKTQGTIGGGDDPIGFLIASYEAGTASPKCPFDDAGYSLDINVPCPVCGDLGDFKGDSKCVSP